MKRLMMPSGNMMAQPIESQALVRRAILVHSGPNGSMIDLMSSDGAISFDDKRIKKIIEVNNTKISKLADDYGGFDLMPVGACPPFLDLHNGEDSVDRTIGRLKTLFEYVVMDVPGVGQNCSCVVGHITFLGQKTMEQVQDGRIYHISIGIDEDTNIISETSAVIDPAAPGAMLLKKGDIKMSKRLKAHKAKVTKLTAMKEALTLLSKKTVLASDKVKLAKKQGNISHRLTSLVRGAKMTPAEYKKLDIKKLSAMTDEQLDVMCSVLEAREPQVMVGQRGSSAAISFSDISKDMNESHHKKLANEIKGDMKKLSKNLKFKSGDPEKESRVKHLSAETKAVDEKVEMSSGMDDEMESCLAAGNMDEIKKCWGKMKGNKKHLSAGLFDNDDNSSALQEANNEMQQQIDELHTNLARVCGMVDELMDVEQEEGHELVGSEVDSNAVDGAENATEMAAPGAEQAAVDAAQSEQSGEVAPEEKELAAPNADEQKPEGEMPPAEDKKDLAAPPAPAAEEKPVDKKDNESDDKEKEEKKKALKKELTKFKKKKKE